MKNIIPALLLALGIAIAGIAIAYSIYSFKNFDHYVAVKGLSERTVKSNEAIWQIKMNVADNDLSIVYQQITDAQKKLNLFLTSQGFSQNDIELMPIDVLDREAQLDNNKATKRYSANAGIVLHTNAVDQVIAAQQKVSQLVQQGIVLSQSQVSYFFTQLNKIKPAMLTDATDNAKMAAELFAQNAHNTLGKIRNASQGMFTIEDLSQQDYRQNSSVMKNVRLVTSVEYFLR